jgi:DNA-binding transcriptional MerR regulator
MAARIARFNTVLRRDRPNGRTPPEQPGKKVRERVDSNTVILHVAFVMREFTLEELAEAVRGWCDKHGVFPANGQAAEELSERTIRYYRTLGLLDPPVGNYVKTFTDKHRLQLIAIRVYQAQGIPLRKIRDELYGKSLEDLAAFEKLAARKGKQSIAENIPLAPVSVEEDWSVVPLGQGFLLVNRERRHLPQAVIKQINQLLLSVHPANDDLSTIQQN